MSNHEMTIIPHSFEENFVICSRFSAQDPKITFAAKGLLWCLLSRPKTWIVRIGELASLYQGKRQRGNGRDAIYEMIEELKENRYIYYQKIRKKNGQYQYSYHVFHTPYSEEQIKIMFPHPDYPDLDNPDLDNPDLVYPDDYKVENKKVDKEERRYKKQQQQQSPPQTPPPEGPVVVVVSSDSKKDTEDIQNLLKPFGESSILKEIALSMTLDEVSDAVKAVNQCAEREDLENPQGCLRVALLNKWKPSVKFVKEKNVETQRPDPVNFKGWDDYKTDNNRINGEKLSKAFLEVKDQYPGRLIHCNFDSIKFRKDEYSEEIEISFKDPEFHEKVIEAKKMLKEM